MAIFGITTRPSTILYDLERLPYSESCLKPELVRVQEAQGLQLVFYRDFKRIMEAGDSSFLQMVNRNKLDIDRVGIVIEEVDVIDHPHYLNDAKHYVNPKKVYIRPMNTKKGRKLLEDALNRFELYNDPTLFDHFVSSSTLAEDGMVDAITQGIKKGTEQGWKRHKEEIKSSIKSIGLKAALAAGGLYAANQIVSGYTKQYADEDARKHPYERSDLIRKLRMLRGKLPEYESKYQRAEREKWENRGIIGKIIYKIKTAIANILIRLRRH